MAYCLTTEGEQKKRTIYERVGRVYRVEEREMERRIECDKKKTEIRTEKVEVETLRYSITLDITCLL